MDIMEEVKLWLLHLLYKYGRVDKKYAGRLAIEILYGEEMRNNP